MYYFFFLQKVVTFLIKLDIFREKFNSIGDRIY